MDPCIIVNDRNQYFQHWAAKWSPRYDGDDHHVTVPEWTSDPNDAYVFSSYKPANKARERMWIFGVAVIRYSECS